MLFFAALMLIRVRFVITLRDSLSLRIRILFFSIRILPSDQALLEDESISPKKKRKILEKLARKRAKKAARAAAKAERSRQKKKGGEKGEEDDKDKKKEKPPKKRKLKIIALIRFAARAAGILLSKFGRHLYVEVKRLKITVASDDAARTAYIFGGVSQAVAYLFAILEKAVRFKANSSEISVRADFLAEKTSQDMEIVLSMRPGGLFLIAFSAIGQALKFFFHRDEYFKPVKDKKGGKPGSDEDSKKASGKDEKIDSPGKDRKGGEKLVSGSGKDSASRGQGKGGDPNGNKGAKGQGGKRRRKA